MQFSDTTNKNGLIQVFERLTRMPDGTVTGTLLKQVTAQINEAYEDILPILLSFNDQIRWDDVNNTDAPVGRMNLVSSQNDYKVTTDGNSLDILNITKVRVLQSSTGTQYFELERITLDDPRVGEMISPTTGITGVPKAFVEIGNTIYFDVKPSYSATNGIELFFGRQQVYFVSTDTTKAPGFTKPFHKILAIIAAHEWSIVNRTNDGNLISRLEAMREKKLKDFKSFMGMRFPSKAVMRATLPDNYE